MGSEPSLGCSGCTGDAQPLFRVDFFDPCSGGPLWAPSLPWAVSESLGWDVGYGHGGIWPNLDLMTLEGFSSLSNSVVPYGGPWWGILGCDSKKDSQDQPQSTSINPLMATRQPGPGALLDLIFEHP